MKKMIILICLVIFNSLMFGETINGRVAYVLDGDTVHIISKGMKHKIRLYGVDAPEKTQDYWSEAKKFTLKKLEGKTVRVEVQEEDKEGFKVGKLYYNEKYYNEEIAKAGYAWWYETKAKRDVDLKEAELYARIERIGLWQGRNMISPWDYKKGVRPTTMASTPKKGGFEMVYIYKGKYHKLGCKKLKGVEKVLPIEEAKKLDYEECSKYKKN